jgi:hypothetical protein
MGREGRPSSAVVVIVWWRIFVHNGACSQRTHFGRFKAIQGIREENWQSVP